MEARCTGGALATRRPPEWCHAYGRLLVPCAMPKPHRVVPTADWSDPRHRRGLWGEQVAMEHLARRGWTIEAHRFRLGHSDVDLVARRGSLVAFVEVKTRGSDGWGTPAESIDWRKRRTIERVAEVWRERHGRRDDVYRFDVVEVRVRPGQPFDVEHMKDAWRLD